MQNGQLLSAETVCTNVLPSFANSHSDLCLDMFSGDTRFYTAYISCARLLICISAARQTVVSSEWDRWANKQGNKVKAAAVKATILDEGFWAAIKLFCRHVKPIVRLMRLVDSNMPSMGKVSIVLHADFQNAAMHFNIQFLTGCNMHAGVPHVCSD